jgi:hypothetical protein
VDKPKNTRDSEASDARESHDTHRQTTMSHNGKKTDANTQGENAHDARTAMCQECNKTLPKQRHANDATGDTSRRTAKPMHTQMHRQANAHTPENRRRSEKEAHVQTEPTMWKPKKRTTIPPT